MLWRNPANDPTWGQVRNGKGLISRAAIRRVVQEIADRFRPDQIILFGSYAYGTPTPESDVDLLVVMPARNAIDQEIKINRVVDPPFPLDINVCKPKDLAWRLAEGDWFLREVVSKGRSLYTSNGLDWTARRWPIPEPGFGVRGGRHFRSRPMKKLTKEWVRKAEQDWQVIKKIRNVNPPLQDMVCYHGQQCAEKYLKALMQELSLVAPRTHDLLSLLNRLVPHDGALRALRRGLKNLNKYSGAIRYPLTNASVVQARAAYRHAGVVRKEIRKRLGI